MKKIKCWVVYSDDFHAGLVYQNREDALYDAKETRESGKKAYTRVRFYTEEELSAIPEV